jgi:hypothetical protein
LNVSEAKAARYVVVGSRDQLIPSQRVEHWGDGKRYAFIEIFTNGREVDNRRNTKGVDDLYFAKQPVKIRAEEEFTDIGIADAAKLQDLGCSEDSCPQDNSIVALTMSSPTLTTNGMRRWTHNGEFLSGSIDVLVYSTPVATALPFLDFPYRIHENSHVDHHLEVRAPGVGLICNHKMSEI